MTIVKSSPLTLIAQQVAEKRYFRKDDDRNIIEDWAGLARRVANHVCKNEDTTFKDEIFHLIHETKFLPNSPCLVNSGTNIGGLLACFVTKAPEDSWIGMCENLANFGHIARRGGGCGVSFSNIRPENDPVFGSMHAKACGPIKHMTVVSEAMHSITQAGFRGMANMGTLMIHHPDIIKFVLCKQRDNALRTMLREDIFNHYDQIKDRMDDQSLVLLDKHISNFNISVVATDDFMRQVEADGDFDLKFNDKVYQTIKARDLFNVIVENAWRNGDPGMLFYETMNKGPYKHSNQEITATNPCGEQQLPEWGSCNLGSIDVSKFYNNARGTIDWVTLRQAIRDAVQFLDCVIDINKFPTKEFEKWARDNRPVGLGIMGFADLLLKLELAYGSPDALKFAKKLAKFFADEAHKRSVELAEDKGVPTNCKYDALSHRRNATTISIAPTGSISLLAGCSSSIEPIFSDKIFRYDNTGEYEMIHDASDKPYFRCALSGSEDKWKITWEEHIDTQAAFQQYCDSGISKTINMENSATMEDVSSAYMRAWKSGCKGVTIYRDGCKTTQVLNTKKKVGILGVNNAVPRPKEVDADIFKTRADGMDWHVIVGKIDGTPYELFAVNGKVHLPDSARIVKRKKRHYSLMSDENEVLIENLAEEEKKIHPKVSCETRRFSLELRHAIHPKYIVQQIDKSNEVITSFTKAVSRIFKGKYLSREDCCAIAEEILCQKCAENGELVEMVPESGCWRCPTCQFSRCG